MIYYDAQTHGEIGVETSRTNKAQTETRGPSTTTGPQPQPNPQRVKETVEGDPSVETEVEVDKPLGATRKGKRKIDNDPQAPLLKRMRDQRVNMNTPEDGASRPPSPYKTKLRVAGAGKGRSKYPQ
jgi:hypothetical protein